MMTTWTIAPRHHRTHELVCLPRPQQSFSEKGSHYSDVVENLGDVCHPIQNLCWHHKSIDKAKTDFSANESKRLVHHHLLCKHVLESKRSAVPKCDPPILAYLKSRVLLSTNWTCGLIVRKPCPIGLDTMKDRRGNTGRRNH